MKKYYELELWDLFEGKVTMRITYDEIRCKFCNSVNVVKNGIRWGTQYWLCKTCGRGFVGNRGLPHMRYPIEAVGSAVNRYYTGTSLNEIREGLDQDYGIRPVDSTIYSWVVKFSKIATSEANKIMPVVGNVWIADETMLSIGGRKVWLWDIIDEKTRFLLATHISYGRTTSDARKLVETAAIRAGKTPKVIRTDYLQGYIDGIELAFGADTKHIPSKPFIDRESTNIIERFHGTLKSRLKVMRGLKTVNSAKVILDGWLVYYNYFRPHDSLNNRTPAEVANSKLQFNNWVSVVEDQSPIAQEDKKPFDMNQDYTVPFIVRPYRRRIVKPHKQKRTGGRSSVVVIAPRIRR